METVAAIAAIMAAVISALGLGLALWWRRPRLEVRVGADAASGSAEGRSTKVFDVYVHNVGSTPFGVRAALVLDGQVVGDESETVTVTPSTGRRFPLSLSEADFARVEQGAPLAARVRFRDFVMRSVEVERGKRKSV